MAKKHFPTQNKIIACRTMSNIPNAFISLLLFLIYKTISKWHYYLITLLYQIFYLFKQTWIWVLVGKQTDL